MIHPIFLLPHILQAIGQELLPAYDDPTSAAGGLADLAAWNRTCTLVYNATLRTLWTEVSLPREYEPVKVAPRASEHVHELHFEGFRNRYRKEWGNGSRTQTLAMRSTFENALVLYCYMRTKNLVKIHSLEVRVLGDGVRTDVCSSALPAPASGFMDLHRLRIFMRDEHVRLPPLPLHAPSADLMDSRVFRWYIYLESVGPTARIPSPEFHKELVRKRLFSATDSYPHALEYNIRTPDTRGVDEICRDLVEQLEAHTASDALSNLPNTHIDIKWIIKLTRPTPASPLPEEAVAVLSVALYEALDGIKRTMQPDQKVTFDLRIRQCGRSLIGLRYGRSKGEATEPALVLVD